MSKVGQILEVNKDGRVVLEGYIGTLDLEIAFDLVPNPDQLSEKAPDYIIYGKSKNGQSIEIGAAWKKTYSDNGYDKEMLTITLDDPSFSAPLNVAAFKDQSGAWVISFRRRQKQIAK